MATGIFAALPLGLRVRQGGMASGASSVTGLLFRPEWPI
jgi:hypothetical protein